MLGKAYDFNTPDSDVLLRIGLWRKHPTKGWQAWSTLGCFWRTLHRDDAVPNYMQVSWLDTWAEPEEL